MLKVSEHTIDIVLRVISNESVNLPIGWIAPRGIQKAVEVFVGYLLLDAWIGNGDRHHTIDVFNRAARYYPEAASIWLNRLESISQANILNIFNRIPNTRISPIAANFAQRIIEFNQHRLLKLRETLP
ncbi:MULTISPECIES: hypothetical protein [Kamptonema]|uniref:hypothetical protein n=1 Tax=Kamptonema TaxID=1501433 RepID=UPI0001DAD27D|nr:MULTISPECIES: hypothetical protein [Kamptonema]CBN58812.1 conserved hypothetical protein [Kamptonema sp. PCC 6506]